MWKNAVMAMLLAFGSVTVLSACDQDGPAEEAGENIDDSMERTGEKMEETGERIQEKAEDAGN